MADEEAAPKRKGEKGRTGRLLPFGLIAFVAVCLAMMVALGYYVWKLIDGL